MFKLPNPIQMVDERCGLIMPWYTFPCLDYLRTLDYSQWEVFEWGGGCSTVWYSFNCKFVDALENDPAWASEIREYLLANGQNNFNIKVVPVPPSANAPSPNMDEYLRYMSSLGKMFDCIIIDGSYRNDAIPVSIEYLKPGGYLIFDNFEQDTSGYVQLPNKHLIDDESLQVFSQPDRPYWKTAVWRKQICPIGLVAQDVRFSA